MKAEDLEEWRKLIGEVGRGEPVDGAFVLMNENCVVYADQDGNPVAPDDQAWNSDKALLERRIAKQEKSCPKS